jgi:hypothetical protein
MATATAQHNVSTDVWAAGLLSAVGAPVTANNVNNIKIWLHQEQNASSWQSDMYNPLGVERNGVVTPFSSVAAGIQGTAGLLTSDYPQIVAALKQNRNKTVFAQTVISSNWNSNYYGATGLSNWLSKGPLNASGTSQSGPGNEVSRLLGDVGLPGGGVVQDISSGVSGAASGVTSAASGIGTFFGDITSGAWWKRVGIFAGGAVMFGVGLALFISTTGPGKQGSQTILQQLPEMME